MDTAGFPRIQSWPNGWSDQALFSEMMVGLPLFVSMLDLEDQNPLLVLSVFWDHFFDFVMSIHSLKLKVSSFLNSGLETTWLYFSRVIRWRIIATTDFVTVAPDF